MIYFFECKDVPSHFDCGHNMLPPLSSEYVNTILTQRFLANSWRGVPGFFFYYLEVYVLSTDGGKVRFHLSPFYNISRNCHNNIYAPSFASCSISSGTHCSRQPYLIKVSDADCFTSTFYCCRNGKRSRLLVSHALQHLLISCVRSRTGHE